jgi:exopolyphosphatase/guanosine-5'-triphosphate,3'-diphosphate pyrophosphatase
VLLVRNAKAPKRRTWDGPQSLRPLSARGQAQAESLVDALADLSFDAILTGPSLRCRQTVDPLASGRALPPRVCEELGEGSPVEKMLARILAEPAETLICCAHGAQLRELAPGLEEAGVHADLLDPATLSCDPEPEARLAVLDLGSTSFHLLVADLTRTGHLTPVERQSVMLRLGAVIASGRKIPAAVREKVVTAAGELAETARRAGATTILPVGTAALRDAPNGSALAAAIAERVGAPVRIVAGEEEARLIFRAFRRRVLLPAGRALGVDLGGGSLELVVGDARELHFEATLPLGAARLSEELVAADPMRRREIRAVNDRVWQRLEPLRPKILAARPEACIVAGGTARALGHLAVAMRGLRPVATVNQLDLTLAELRSITEVLVHTDHAQRLALPGVQRRRADLLPTGALILLGLAEVLEVGRYTLCDWGLREGVMLEAAARRGGEVPET